MLKYKAVSLVLLLFFSGTLISVIQTNTEKNHLEEVIKQKEKRIALIKEPLREDTYIEDLYKNIGFKLNKVQYEKFSELALKYRTKIEDAKVPATLVYWVAFKESRFDVNARSSESSAKGMFQFIDGTWNSMCKFKGVSHGGRFDEEKQFDIMLVYLNHQYHKEKSWKKVMRNYHGGEYLYPTNFLFK